VVALVVQCVEGNYRTLCKGTLFYLTTRITHPPSRVTAVFTGISVCRGNGFTFLVNCIVVNSRFLLVFFFFGSRTHVTSKLPVVLCTSIFY